MQYKPEDIEVHKRHKYTVIGLDSRRTLITASYLEVSNGCYHLWIVDTILDEKKGDIILKDLVACYGIGQVAGVVKHQGGDVG